MTRIVGGRLGGRRIAVPAGRVGPFADAENLVITQPRPFGSGDVMGPVIVGVAVPRRPENQQFLVPRRQGVLGAENVARERHPRPAQRFVLQKGQ